MIRYLERAREIASRFPARERVAGILPVEGIPGNALVGSETKVEWLQECLDSEKRFGEPHAKLFPLLGKRVWTSHGSGILWRVFADSAGVALESDSKKVTFVKPEEVGPKQMQPNKKDSFASLNSPGDRGASSTSPQRPAVIRQAGEQQILVYET